MDSDETSLRIVVLVIVFSVFFCVGAWLYYHGFYEGYFAAYSDYRTGKIENPDSDRFKHRFESRLKK